MKEIGSKLKEARLANGVSIEEAAEDLKLRPIQVENIEEGNIKAFKDVYYLKYFIRDYAKYLSLDYDKLIADFNEFLFDYTSKIPLEQIEKAKKEDKENKKKNPRKYTSPYTLQNGKKITIPPLAIYILIGIAFIVIIYLIFDRFSKDDFVNEDTSYKIEEVQYELT